MMACDLWGPSFTGEDSSYCIQPEWQYDFYFGYGIDMIEENALNEKSCVQVLRILIANADTEIDELEKELVLLQSELISDEHEEWHDICCNALRSKINCLDISIKKLRSKDENDIEVFLLVHTEPSEKLHEIVKALLKSFCHEKNEQNEQSQDVVLHSRSGSPDNSAALHKDQKSSSSDPYSIEKEENNAPSGTPKEKFTSSSPSTELEVKKTNSSETVKLANAEVNDLMPHSLLLAAGQLDEKSIVTMLDLEIIKSLKKNVSTIKDKNTIQHFSSKSARKRTNSLNRTKAKDAAAQCVNNSDPDALKHSAGHLNKKKKLNSSSLMIVSDEVTMHTSTADMLILDSPNSMGITAGLSKKVKDVLTANIIAEDLCSSTLKPTADHSGEMKVCTHDPKVHGCEMQRCNTTTIRKSIMPNSCLNPEHEGNIQKVDTVESSKCDMEQKLCDFVVKSPRKQGVKEFKVASTNKKQHSNSLFKGDENREDPLPVVTRKEATLTENEFSALTSLIELQDGSGDKTACCMGGKPQMEEVQMPEIVASDDKLVPNLYVRLQGGVVKNVAMNVESTPAEVEESGLKSKQNVSNSPSFPKGKKVNNHTLSYSLTGRIIKKTVQHSQHKAEVPSMMPGTSQNTISLPQKRCKKLSSVPIVVNLTGSCNQTNISKLHGDLNRTDAAMTDFVKPETSIDNSSLKGMTSLPSEASSLMKMKLSDLKAIAKSQKLKKYSTMKKEDLVKQLENRLSC